MPRPGRDYFGSVGPSRPVSGRDYMRGARGGGERRQPPDGVTGDASGSVATDEAAIAGPERPPDPNGANGRTARLLPTDNSVNDANGIDGVNGNGHAAPPLMPRGQLAAGVVAAPAAPATSRALPANGTATATAAERPAAATESFAPPSGTWNRTIDSMRLPAFRWLFLAMLGQFTAMNMQMLVRGYLVFDLTGSFAALGLISLANAVPMFLFSVFGGVLADRVSRKLVLQIGQFLNAVIAASIGALIFLDMLQVEHLFMSAALQGGVWALMLPARQAVIPEVVGERRLMNAVALNTAGMNLMRLLAPGIGGFLVAWIGPEWVYVVMASSFAFAVVTLIPMRTQYASRRTPAATAAATAGRGNGSRTIRDLVEGVRYIRASRDVQAILIANFVIVLFSMPYMMLLPGFVADVLDGGADRLGILQSLTGVGALAGSMVVAAMTNRHRGRMLLISSLLLGVALIAFTISRSFWLTAAIMIPIGVGQAGRMSLSNVLVQAYTEDAYRGRVMSVYMMEFGLVSFGVFVVGVLASMFGVALAIGGTAAALVVTMVLALLFYPRLRDLE